MHFLPALRVTLGPEIEHGILLNLLQARCTEKKIKIKNRTSTRDTGVKVFQAVGRNPLLTPASLHSYSWDLLNT